MTEQTINPKIKEMSAYQYGGLSARLMSERNADLRMVGASLEMLADDMDAFAGPDRGRRRLFRNSVDTADKRLMGMISDSYGGAYSETLGDLTFGELFGHYKSDVIAGYADDDTMSKYENEFTKYAGEKVTDVIKKIKIAKRQLEEHAEGTTTLSDADKTAAEETMEKYGKVLDVYHIFEDIKFNDKLMPNVHKKALKKIAEGL
ncbi:MAG: hypothetical protein Q7R52_03930 [archaeon]|nr:hypothetical protein [archaeon]